MNSGEPVAANRHRFGGRWLSEECLSGCRRGSADFCLTQRRENRRIGVGSLREERLKVNTVSQARRALVLLAI